MKCSRCGFDLLRDQPGRGSWQIAHEGFATYVITVHDHCFRDIVGDLPSRKLLEALVAYGWKQVELPMS